MWQYPPFLRSEPPPPPEPFLGYRGTLPIHGGRLRGIPIVIVQRGAAAPPTTGLVLEVEMKISVERRRDDFIPIEVAPAQVEVWDNVTAWDVDDPNFLKITRTSAGPNDPTQVLVPRDLIRTIRVLP